MTIKLNPTETILEFPASNNTTFNDTRKADFKLPYNQPPIDSVRVKQVKFKRVTADGWGNLITPEGTFASIRLYEEALVVDYVWGRTPFGWTLVRNSSDSVHTYSWMTDNAGVGVPLLTIDYDKTENKSTEIRYYSSIKVCLSPDEQASDLIFSDVDSTSMTLSWQNGNGRARLVVAREGNPVDALPQDGNTYAANSIYGTAGTELGANFIVYNDSSSNSVILTGLNPGAVYYFTVFEYNCLPEKYLAGTPLSGSKIAKICTPPDMQATGLVFSNIDSISMTLSWQNGNGSGRIVVAREGTSVDDVPVNGNAYTANADYGTPGTELGDNFIVLNGSVNSGSNNVTVIGLKPSTNYHFAIFEYDCMPEQFLTQLPLSGSETTLAPPPPPPIGLEEFVAKEELFSVHPNPITKGEMILFNNQVSIRIFNSKGQLVLSERNVRKVNSSLSGSGFYFILTEHNQRVKIIVN